MLLYKTKEEIELIRKSSCLVTETLAEVARHIGPGVATLYIDRIAEEFIRDHGAKPGFKGYNNFPNTLCISVNNEVVHGIPSSYQLKEGDIVSVDCGVVLNGFYGDMAYTFPVGKIHQTKKKLLKYTLDALYKGVEKAVVGNRLGDIGHAVQQHAESGGFSVVR
jgi:methionyl aminopeptidase